MLLGLYCACALYLGIESGGPWDTSYWHGLYVYHLFYVQ